MMKNIALGLGALLAIFLGYVAMQPADYEIAREIQIHKSPDVIFPFINNPKQMEQWSPWVEVDPAVVMNYSGPEFGVGAKAEWDSQGRMGSGSATIIESTQNQSVHTALEYTRPFGMTQTAEISIQFAEPESTVRWSVKGQNTFVGRLMCTFMNMDKMVGGNFETGLAKLKAIVEKDS